MKGYTYKAINEFGRTVSGVIDAPSLEDANEAIAALGHIPTSVRPRLHSLSIGWDSVQRRLTTVRPYELILFTKRLLTF